MAELDFTNISNSSINTPATGVTALFADLDKKLKIKTDAGIVVGILLGAVQSIATAGGTTTMVNSDPMITIFTGSSAQTIKLPDATTIQQGAFYIIRNDSSGLVTVANGAGSLQIVLSPGCSTQAVLVTAGSQAGTWNFDPIGFWADPTDVTKKIVYSSSGATTGTNLTIAEAQSTSQTLNIPNLTGASILIVDTLAQTITGVKTMTNMTTAAGTTGVPSMTITNGTNLTTAAANAVENDGAGLYFTTDTTEGRTLVQRDRLFRLTSNGSAISGIADVFGTNDGAALVANGVYELEWNVILVQNTGAGTSFTWTIVTATTALASITAWYNGSPTGGWGTVGAPQHAGASGTSNSSLALPITGSPAAATHQFTIRALVVAGNGASNTRLRLTVGANNATPQAGSYFRVRRLVTNTGAFVA